MNFEEMQLIWDKQRKETMYAINQEGLARLIDKQTFAIARDLKCLELSAFFVLLGLGAFSLIDTFFNGEEYFQLIGAPIEFAAAAFLWHRRRQRERRLKNDANNLVEEVRQAITRIEATIQRGRDLTYFFSVFVLYGALIRIAIYGWPGSEIKFLLAIIMPLFLFTCFELDRRRTHAPRKRDLEALHSKLIETS